MATKKTLNKKNEEDIQQPVSNFENSAFNLEYEVKASGNVKKKLEEVDSVESQNKESEEIEFKEQEKTKTSFSKKNVGTVYRIRNKYIIIEDSNKNKIFIPITDKVKKYQIGDSIAIE